MKMARFLLIVLVIGFGAMAARADVVDPKIIIGGGGSCSLQSLNSFTQSFSGIDTSCVTDFQNNISNDDEGVTLFQIVVNVTSAFTGPLSCDVAEGSPFNNGFASSATSCTFNNIVPESFLSALVTSGVGPGQIFSLQFDNEGGTGFGPTVDLTISQTVLPTPEPASALLLLAGAGALAAFRKRRQATA